MFRRLLVANRGEVAARVLRLKLKAQAISAAGVASTRNTRENAETCPVNSTSAHNAFAG